MASRRVVAPLAYSRNPSAARGATRVGRRSLVLVVGLLALAAFAGVLYLSQASEVAQLNFRLAETEKATHDLREQNLALHQEIAARSSLAAVETRAAHLGMVEGSLEGPYLICAVPQAEPALAYQPGMAALPADGALWGQLARRLGLARAAGSEQLATSSPQHP